MLPLRPGQLQPRTHDYKRHGTTNLYAAFNVATGEVLGRVTCRPRATEFRRFLAQIDRATPPHLPCIWSSTTAAPIRPRRSATSCPRIPAFPALHADERVVAQRRRDVARPLGAACAPAGRLHQRHRPAGDHPRFHRPPQHLRREALRLTKSAQIILHAVSRAREILRKDTSRTDTSTSGPSCISVFRSAVLFYVYAV